MSRHTVKMDFNKMIQTSCAISRNANNLEQSCPRLTMLVLYGTLDIAEVVESNRWLKNETNLIDFAMYSGSWVVSVVRLSQPMMYLMSFHIILHLRVRLPASCKRLIALLDTFSLNAFSFNLSCELFSDTLHASSYSIHICFLSSERSTG
jgi:hypothetical protein